jgi:DNA processing protein
MNSALSPNGQAILLLTAPLEIGRNAPKAELLKPSEYRELARHLMELGQEPADLLSSGSDELRQRCGSLVGRERLETLLGRGFLLSQALERWQARAIWVVSRADPDYPERLKTRLGNYAPPVLYGCGPMDLLSFGGLAVVGSRKVNEELTHFAHDAGRLAAGAGRILVSGGAKGVDLSAMQGALDDGGRACGVLADNLERTSLKRENRDWIIDDRLTLVSPYDPGAGFNVGNAMQRNKLIYALADAALVVNADLEKGGTWAGAVEQLKSLKLVPVFVRASGARSRALDALRGKGALEWPDAQTPELFERLMARVEAGALEPDEPALLLFEGAGDSETDGSLKTEGADAAPAVTHNDRKGDSVTTTSEDAAQSRSSSNPEGHGVHEAADPERMELESVTPADELFETVRRLIVRLLESPKAEAEVAGELNVSGPQARAWLKRLIADGQVEKSKQPVRYVRREKELFE